ncbi:hypothetical protein MFIFM68171_05815 [Madurella fahalii]|uniref:Protein kinase domain-containing protein n=1 Tax=Madurella fahalii TaxID=1157608 RepID=A0ABQ0GCW5_9PEZI
MGEPGDGWHTVMPTSHSAIERLSQSQVEACERQILREWEASHHHWSGIGKHTPLDDFTEAKKLHNRFKIALDTPLGIGGFGVVQKVQYNHGGRSICLARKLLRPRRRGVTVQSLREEANIMEKLDHDHIVKLVGTYCIRSDLYLLLWPVAVCNLDCLLNDLECLQTGHGDREDIICRLHALDLTDLSAIDQARGTRQTCPSQGNCPLKYLQQIMGCITRAVAYCHQANIRHLDLKPSNILLNPGRVYLADFGIAKDVHDREHTMTRGVVGTAKWTAPERQQVDSDWSMKTADVYSLGMVLLGMATVIHRAPLDDFDCILNDLSPASKAEKLDHYVRKLEGIALATQEVEDANAPTFGPKHVVNLASKMLSPDPAARPVIFQVDAELVDLGGINQVYHSPCCKRSSRFVTERMNHRFKLAIEERDRLRAEVGDMAKRLKVLEAKDVTYETRIRNERKTQAENIAALQAKLEKERSERKRLETLIAEMQQQNNRKQPRPGIPRPGSGHKPPNGSPSPGSGSSVIRARPPTHPLPNAGSRPEQSPSQAQLQAPPPVAMPNGRLSYSQTAAAAVAPRTVSQSTAACQDSTARPSPLPFRAPVASGSPTPETAGFPLLSRNSASRLPRAVNPATPMRSSTPLFNYDQSLTDSTQNSMSSSVFSRLSQSRYSLAETSVAGTPPVGSPAINDKRKDSNDMPPADHDQTISPVSPTSNGASHGVGLGLLDLTQRRESVTSARDTASVISSAPTGTASPVLTSSVLSSPRSAFASVGSRNGGPKVPPLPTAPSWADVARRERRG